MNPLAGTLARGTAVLLAGLTLLGCTAPRAEQGPSSAATNVDRAARREAFRLQTRVWGEGRDVRVEGVVHRGGEAAETGHADIAVYAPDGSLLATASAPYHVIRTEEGRPAVSFAARLPGLRGRGIRLRILPHGTLLDAGGTCGENTAIEEERDRDR